MYVECNAWVFHERTKLCQLKAEYHPETKTSCEHCSAYDKDAEDRHCSFAAPLPAMLSVSPHAKRDPRLETKREDLCYVGKGYELHGYDLPTGLELYFNRFCECCVVCMFLNGITSSYNFKYIELLQLCRVSGMGLQRSIRTMQAQRTVQAGDEETMRQVCLLRQRGKEGILRREL